MVIKTMAARRFAKMLRHAVDVGAIPARTVMTLADDLNDAAGDLELVADEARETEKLDRCHSDLAGVYAEAIENLFPTSES
jgi:hypothetical protein